MIILATTAWSQISDALTAITICAVMPTLIVWFNLKFRNRQFEKRIELAKIALEKDPSLDMGEYLAKLTPAKKTFAQKSVTLILVSSILIFLGLAAATIAIVFNSKDIEDGFAFFGIVACIFLGLGLAFLVSFFYTRKLVRKGILN